MTVRVTSSATGHLGVNELMRVRRHTRMMLELIIVTKDPGEELEGISWGY